MENVLNILKEKNFNPIDQMRMLASGDVVGLELMTQEEYDEEAEFDIDGIQIAESGKDRAVKLIPVRIRAQMSSELAKYTYHQKKAVEDDDAEVGDKTHIHVYVPANGRDQPVPPEVIKDKPKKKTIKKKAPVKRRK